MLRISFRVQLLRHPQITQLGSWGKLLRQSQVCMVKISLIIECCRIIILVVYAYVEITQLQNLSNMACAVYKQTNKLSQMSIPCPCDGHA